MKLITKDYIVTKSEMVSTLSPFKQKLCKWFGIQERKGSIFTVTVVLNSFPSKNLSTSKQLTDSYGTSWEILDRNMAKKTVKIQNTKPIYGLNKKVMHGLVIQAA